MVRISGKPQDIQNMQHAVHMKRLKQKSRLISCKSVPNEILHTQANKHKSNSAQS